MRYPPIIVALSRDLEFNLSIRRSGTWYPIAPSASERDSISRYFPSNFRESVASAVGRATGLLHEVFPFRLPGVILPGRGKEPVRNMPGETHRRLFLSQRRREKRTRLVLLCERNVGYVSWWRSWTGGHRSTWVNWDPYWRATGEEQDVGSKEALKFLVRKVMHYVNNHYGKKDPISVFWFVKSSWEGDQ